MNIQELAINKPLVYQRVPGGKVRQGAILNVCKDRTLVMFPALAGDFEVIEYDFLTSTVLLSVNTGVPLS